jgi:hypothetical protein
MEQLFQAQFQIGIHAERINRSGGCAKRGQTRSRQKIGVPGSFAKIGRLKKKGPNNAEFHAAISGFSDRNEVCA